MPHELDLILTLAGALSAALVFGLVAQKLRLSPIVGYVVAGIVVGPFTPGVVVDRELAEQLAELGVVVLLFDVGLHFRAKDLLAARRIAIPGALLQVAVATALGATIAVASGWSIAAGVVLGASISVASTILLTRLLADHDALHTEAGRIAVAWLLVEDLLTVLALVILPIVGASDPRRGSDVAWALLGAAVKVALLVAFTWIAGRRAIPALLAWVGKMRSRELFTLAVLVIGLGIAVGSAALFGASIALGSFLAGMVVAQTPSSARAASEALPIRDAFAVIFFVSVGMLFDPRELLPNLPLTLAILAIVLVAKPLAAYLLVRLSRRPRRVAAWVALALGQIGEFSFVLVSAAGVLGVVPDAAVQVVVAAALVSIVVNPVAFRMLSVHAPLIELGRTGRRAIVVGYDAIGRALVGLLLEHGIEPTVVELDLRVVRALQRRGVRAVHGDASEPEVLERAGLSTAAAVLVAWSRGLANEVVTQGMAAPGRARFVVRSADARDPAAAQTSGAHVVGEEDDREVASAMLAHVTDVLGGPPRTDREPGLAITPSPRPA